MTDRTKELVAMLTRALDWIENRKKSDIIESVQNRVNIDTNELRRMSLDELNAMNRTIKLMRPSFVSGTQVGTPDARTSAREKLNNMNRDFMMKIRNRERV